MPSMTYFKLLSSCHQVKQKVSCHTGQTNVADHAKNGHTSIQCNEIARSDTVNRLVCFFRAPPDVARLLGAPPPALFVCSPGEFSRPFLAARSPGFLLIFCSAQNKTKINIKIPRSASANIKLEQ